MKYADLALIMVTAGGFEQALADPGPPINLVSNSNSNFTPKAVPDAVWGLTNCVVSGGTEIVYCPAPANITVSSGSGLPPQVLVADDVGSGRTPLVANITSVGLASGTVMSGETLTNGILLTLNSSSTYNNAVSVASGGTVTPLANHVPGVTVTSAGSGYSFGTTQTMSCVAPCSTGDGHESTLLTPAIMTETPMTAGVVSGSAGTGGTSGYCSSLTPTTEVGIDGSVIVFGGSISASGALMTPLTLISSGMVTADNGTYSSSTGKYSERFVGCGFTSSTGPMISFKYSVVSEQVANPGAGLYAQTAPCVSSSVGMASSTDGGMNLTVSCGGTLSYPGTVSFGTDNTSAFRAALGVRGVTSGGTMNAAAAKGSPECLYLPAGNYLTEPLNQYSGAVFPASGSNIAQGYGCWLGDEHYHSNVFVIPNIEGDVFAWVDCAQNSSIVSLVNTQTFSNFGTAAGQLHNGTANQAGASFRNLTIIGDRLSTQQQNGLVFYGPTQFGYLDNIVVDFLLGKGFYGGALDASTGGKGEFTESIVQNARFEDDGEKLSATAPIPTFEITATGASEGSNTDSLTNIRIYQSIGTAFWIHSAGTTDTRFFRMTNVFIEGSGVSNGVNGGDLMLLGDPTETSGAPNISDIVGRNIQLLNPVLNYAALRLTGVGAATQVANIDIDGFINSAGPSSPGRGLQVEICTHCTFKFADDNTVDYALVIGARQPPLPCTAAEIGTPGVTFDAELGDIGSTKPSSIIAACLDPTAPSVSIPSFGTFN